MRVRASKDLSQLSDSEFFQSVSEGLDLIRRHAIKLHDGASAAAKEKQNHACRVLGAIAEEEAAKFLILVDAVRCPRQPNKRFVNQLARFNDHLAKGLYADACSWRAMTLGQLQEYIDNSRRQFYLDGPNDVDWIFPNEVLNNRESAFYVDYVANDDGHVWTDPTQHDDLLLGPIEPWSLKMACALSDAGFASPEGLSIIAKTWRPASFDLTTGWEVFRGLNLRTLRALDTAGLLQPQPNDVYSHIVRNWQFPMYDLDVQMIPVELEVLREQQRNWSPDW